MPIEEIEIHTQVVMVLLKSETLGKAVIEVESKDGTVILRGTVENNQDKEIAEALVKAQPGVLEVINRLDVNHFDGSDLM